MSEVASVLSQLSCVNVFSKSEKTGADIRAWVASQNYTVQEPICAAAFKLEPSRRSFVAAAIANDCNRMMMACVETIAGIQLDGSFPRCAAWSVIRTYYAAFYAAHAFTKIFGISCTQLEGEHTSKVLESAVIYGQDSGLKKIEANLYRIQYQNSLDCLEFTKLGDSHKGMWSCFFKLLSQLHADIPGKTVADADAKKETMDFISALKTCLGTNPAASGGNFLSYVRNRVNYKHTDGVWFPYVGAPSFDWASAHRNWFCSLEDINLKPLPTELENFYLASTAIINLSRTLLLRGIMLNSSEHIFKNGVLRVLNTIKAA